MRKIFIAFLLLFIGLDAFCQKPSYDDVLRYYHTKKNFNGVVLVADRDTVRFLANAGLADREQKLPFQNRTSIFKIASITKTFTAVMILQLMEEGKLDLNATLSNYLPDYKGPGKDKITIKNLLTYSSGLPNCESYEGDAIYAKPMRVDSFIAKYCSDTLLNTPGTKFDYNNGDYILLGKVIEQLTGASFAENLQRRIFQKLNMQNTGMSTGQKKSRQMIKTYLYNDSLKTFSPDKEYAIENYFSAGAMHSTIEDLLKFDQGIFNYRLLKKETVELMMQPNPALDNVGLGFWYASGFGLLNRPFVYRPGGIYGATVNWIHVIDANRVIIALSNTDATNLFEFSQQLNGVATKQLAALPE